MLRSTEDIIGRTLLDDTALIHKDDLVRGVAGKAHFVQDAHYGDNFARKIEYYVEYLQVNYTAKSAANNRLPVRVDAPG